MLAPTPFVDVHFPCVLNPHDVVVVELEGLLLGLGKRRAAPRADPCGNGDELMARLARLGGNHRLALSVSASASWVDGGDGAVLGDDARKVEDKAMVRVTLWAHPAAGHLDIQRDGQRRPQHGDEVNVWIVEPRGQYVCVSEGSNLSRLEILEDARTLGLWCLACHALCGDTVVAQHIAHALGVLHARAEKQPCLALSGKFKDFTHDGIIHRVGVYGSLQVPLDVFTASLFHSACVQAHLRHLGPQGGEVALEHKLLDGDGLDEVGEKSRRVGDKAVAETAGRGG